GSFATQDEPFMTAVYRELRRANLPFLHVAGVPRSVCKPLASRIGAAYDEPDATIDIGARHADTRAPERAWTAAIERAKQRGGALVLVRLTAASAVWLDHAFSDPRLAGVQLAPVSSVIRRPTVEPD